MTKVRLSTKTSHQYWEWHPKKYKITQHGQSCFTSLSALAGQRLNNIECLDICRHSIEYYWWQSSCPGHASQYYQCQPDYHCNGQALQCVARRTDISPWGYPHCSLVRDNRNIPSITSAWLQAFSQPGPVLSVLGMISTETKSKGM